MNRRVRSKTRGGSTTSIMLMFGDTDEGWECLNISLKTEDAKERKNLWTRKSRLLVA